MERSFTFETRLPRLDYFEEFARHYNHLVRVVWHFTVSRWHILEGDLAEGVPSYQAGMSGGEDGFLS